ncbi:MAG: hypothetical protein K6F80_02550 [Oscillospiraceae bacterium]|nr:hypothetical protein [Oscillospiraceae bacterium]
MINAKKWTALLCAAALGLSSSGCGSLLYLMMQDSRERNAATEAETLELFVGCDLSDEEDARVTQVEIIGTYHADTKVRSKSSHVGHMGVVGRFGCPVEVVSPGMSDAQIVFTYDPDHMKNVPPENLIALFYNEEENAIYDTIESVLDQAAHTVTANISHEGVYLLADAYQWYGAWGADVSEYAHESTYSNEEFRFELDVPKDIVLRNVGDYLHDDEEGKCRTLLECEPNDNVRIGIEYLERPYYDSAKEFMSSIAKILDEQGALRQTGTLPLDTAREGYYCYSDFGDDNEGHSYSINCIIPLSDTQYINLWYGFKHESYEESVFTSLFSFHFTGEPTVPELSEEYEFEKYCYTVGKDISVELPDGLQAELLHEDWIEELDGYDVSLIQNPLLQLKLADPNADTPLNRSFVQGFILLENSHKSARRAAQAAISDAMSRMNTELKDTETVTVADGQNGYLYSVVVSGELWLHGYYNIPGNATQYIHAVVVLRDDADDKTCGQFRNMLKTLNTAKPDQAITADHLRIDFPDGFFANPAKDLGWADETDNDGEQFYRKWLFDTDHQRISEAGHYECCGAFFYLIETGRTAKQDCERSEQHYLQNDKFGYQEKEKTEITMPCGLKGYLYSIRELNPPDGKSYVSSAYLYGFYEVPDGNGGISPQYVEVEYMLNEPLSDDVYQAYWNSLKSVDIVGVGAESETQAAE